MSREGVATLRAAYDAFKRQDVPAVMAAFDERIEWISPDTLPFGGVYRGHAEVGQFFGQLPQHWTDLSVEPQEFIDGGDTVVVVVRLRGGGRAGAMDSEAIHLWRLRSGKAVSFREFSDTALALSALGRPLPTAA